MYVWTYGDTLDQSMVICETCGGDSYLLVVLHNAQSGEDPCTSSW